MRHRMGVLLSVDALLLDVHDARAQAWVEAIAEHGEKLRFETIRRHVSLVPHELLNLSIGAGLDTTAGAAIAERAKTIFASRYLSRVPAHYRAKELLSSLMRSGLRVIAVSADPVEVLLPMLHKLDADNLVHRATYPAKNERLGARRDLLRVALDRASLTPKTAIQLTDSPDDVLSAQKLGLASVALESGGWSRDELKSASGLYRDPGKLLDGLLASPLFRDSDDAV
ncbi:MAG: HAD family hydrolase [Deltaproteobacteria bacterium]|nr:HAD family hydrolase [Deltaproteobacteria bacterium]